jgi:voltage-gated potassium channel Kch
VESIYPIYFSLVTLTTLGYGDIVPTAAAARMLAAVEAVVGQLYLAVLVARLVGLHIAQARRNSESSDQFSQED